MMPSVAKIFVFFVLHIWPCSAFLVGRTPARLGKTPTLVVTPFRGSADIRLTEDPAVRLHGMLNLKMYNLPPSGGGEKSVLTEILTSVGVLLAIVAFFASPLGGLFFAVLNSFFLLSLLLPVILWVGFQSWVVLYTIEGPCPKCSAPVRVLKEEASPSICGNCGTLLLANGDSVDFYREENQVIIDENYSPSIWDRLLGAANAPKTNTRTQFRRDVTIIDVEVEDKE